MYEDKTLVCKECGKEFVFTAGEQNLYLPPVSRNSMLSAASRMSPSAARPAATLARMLPAVPVSSSLLSVQHAAERREFLLNPSLIALCTAASALQE